MNINQLVATKIAAAGPNIADRVVAQLAEEEIVRRTDKVVATIVELNKLQKQLDKIRPDIVTYNEDGSLATQGWSKAKLDEKKKVTDKQAKIQKALDKALDTNDFGDLLGLQFGKDDSTSEN